MHPATLDAGRQEKPRKTPIQSSAVVWPPDILGELNRRARRYALLSRNKEAMDAALAIYKRDPVAFIQDNVFFQEPRNANKGAPTTIPVVPFPRQEDFIRWLKERFDSRTSGPIEKSRDSGATFVCCAFSVWLWLFHPGASVGWGSRKEILVHRKGDMNSIFEKIISIIDHLPPYLLPEGLNKHEHFNFMRLINPANGASIIGEAGDNIGRGGRTSIFFVDESSFLEHPQLVEAALTATTECRVDISSVRAGTLFYEWCQTSPHRFVFEVFDAPWHTPEWIKARRDDLEAKGMISLFKQEYLRDATAGIEGQLIPAEWVEAAVGAAQKLGITPSGKRIAALDVADGGMDRNCLAIRHGIELGYIRSRGDLLADGAGSWAYFEAMGADCSELRYDSIGVGAGAAASLRDKRNIRVVGWNASGEVIGPTTKYEGNRTNGDMFANAKSQAWFGLRTRFLLTYQWVVEGRLGIDPDSIISLDPNLLEIRELKSELSQITYKHNPSGKVLIDKAPDGRPSPNRADSVMIAYAPEKPGMQVIGAF